MSDIIWMHCLGKKGNKKTGFVFREIEIMQTLAKFHLFSCDHTL